MGVKRAFHNCVGSITGLGSQSIVFQDCLGAATLTNTYPSRSRYKHYAPRYLLLHVFTHARVDIYGYMIVISDK